MLRNENKHLEAMCKNIVPHRIAFNCFAVCLPCVAAECYGFSCTSDNIHRYRA